MGAWAAGSFGNDDALDFLDAATSVARVETAVTAVVSAPAGAVDAVAASEAVAACDLVASMMERHAADLPDEARPLAARFGAPSEDLARMAREACARVLADSELAALWDDSEDPDEWRDAMADLLRRLDPDAPYSPAPDDDSDDPDDPDASDGGYSCAFCNEPIADADLVYGEIPFDPAPGLAAAPTVSMTAYFHRACVEARVDVRLDASETPTGGSLPDDAIALIKAAFFS
ncbi:MAG: DUF4259 domain-containing protein [Pseudomonadota bacterium]